MMDKYVLTYFNFRARAELSRLLFAVAGVDYVDERVQPSQWLALKPSLPFGQLPVLSVNGNQICQSHSIARYLAREFGLAGKGNEEQAQADMIVECVADMLEPIMPAYREKCEQKRIEMRRDYLDQLKSYMDRFEKLLCCGMGEDGYIVGNELTWADLSLMNAWHWIPGFGVFPIFEDYPNIRTHKEKIEAHPRISDWLENRPITPV